MTPSHRRLLWRSRSHDSTMRSRRRHYGRHLSHPPTPRRHHRPHGRRLHQSYGRRPRLRPAVNWTMRRSVPSVVAHRLSGSCCFTSLHEVLTAPFALSGGTNSICVAWRGLLNTKRLATSLGWRFQSENSTRKRGNSERRCRSPPTAVAGRSCQSRSRCPNGPGPHERQMLARHPSHRGGPHHEGAG